MIFDGISFHNVGELKDVGGGHRLQRVTYMVHTVAGANTARPVACITLFPHFRDFCVDEDLLDKTAAFRQVLRDVVGSCPHPNVHLIEGPEMLTDLGGLTVDLIHPGDLGMIKMGERIADKLKALLP
ncbi:MAG: hypothetical protein O3B73_16000 [bacterium]|nr:hypothetical protein [bacterium]